MKKEKIKHKTENEILAQQIQNNQIKLLDENGIFSKERINEIFRENNIDVIKPIPIKYSINNNIFLNKKRTEIKGIFHYNNYKIEKQKWRNCAFQSLPFFDNSKMVYPTNKKKSKNFHKSLQIKINVIINNYINTDKQVFNEEKKNNNSKKPIFRIISNKLELNEKYQKEEDNFIPNINSKKFEIFKTDENNGDLNYDEIKKFHRNKKRGRKARVEGKRQHNAFDQDNIIRKIQVHFLSFIIYFSNDLVHAVFPNNKNLNFKNIQYELKKTVNHSYIENLKSKTIGDILQLKASSKNKKFDGNINKTTFEYICGINPFLKNFFKMSYLDMFNNYYCKNDRELIIEGYKIILSERTRLFNDLISKNLSSAIKLKEIANEYFINKKNQSPIFLINKK